MFVALLLSIFWKKDFKQALRIGHTQTSQQFKVDAIAVTISKDRIKESNIFQQHLTLGRKQVCIAAFSRILGISREIQQDEGAILSGCYVCNGAMLWQASRQSILRSLLGWIAILIELEIKCHMWNKFICHTSCRKRLYELMVQQLQDEGICREDKVSSSHFYLEWKIS